MFIPDRKEASLKGVDLGLWSQLTKNPRLPFNGRRRGNRVSKVLPSLYQTAFKVYSYSSTVLYHNLLPLQNEWPEIDAMSPASRRIYETRWLFTFGTEASHHSNRCRFALHTVTLGMYFTSMWNSIIRMNKVCQFVQQTANLGRRAFV